ncbi:uncharacterized protein SPAPADRAFT_52574 [Spathaspora passalidarum NRRL Y-27907]|uniref:Uncharacterized protein n=1 Tax=Spathaspora passalidarum (strain NRRL Y-27907 / 11-Y1) TaxID=619300 RepID=G3AUB8_SPAPN|nr:uncharacterized protein SPAPADRAFT_52574 [Spathaspora passalidarum NRRL Y-27907]EGW30494.1 hypothetical protein SPAPADRAFT_52574 [Spathaspora passalidarum NRRL Y-27907]
MLRIIPRQARRLYSAHAKYKSNDNSMLLLAGIPTSRGWFTAPLKPHHSRASIDLLNQELSQLDPHTSRDHIQSHIDKWCNENRKIIADLSKKEVPEESESQLEDLFQMEMKRTQKKEGEVDKPKANPKPKRSSSPRNLKQGKLKIKFGKNGEIRSISKITKFYAMNYYLHKHLNESNETEYEERKTRLQREFSLLDQVEQNALKEEYTELLHSGYDLIAGLKIPVRTNKDKTDTSAIDGIKLGVDSNNHFVIHGEIPFDNVKKYYIQKRLVDTGNADAAPFELEWDNKSDHEHKQICDELYDVISTGRYIDNGKVGFINLEHDGVKISFKRGKPVVSGTASPYQLKRFYIATRYQETGEPIGASTTKQFSRQWDELPDTKFATYREKYEQMLASGHKVYGCHIVPIKKGIDFEHVEFVSNDRVESSAKGVRVPRLKYKGYYWAWHYQQYCQEHSKVTVRCRAKLRKELMEKWYAMSKEEQNVWQQKYIDLAISGYDVVKDEIVYIKDNNAQE